MNFKIMQKNTFIKECLQGFSKITYISDLYHSSSLKIIYQVYINLTDKFI